jgi:hypothetical protein
MCGCKKKSGSNNRMLSNSKVKQKKIIPQQTTRKIKINPEDMSKEELRQMLIKRMRKK